MMEIQSTFIKNSIEQSTIRFGDSTLVGGDITYDWKPLDDHYVSILRSFLMDTQEHVTFYRDRFINMLNYCLKVALPCRYLSELLNAFSLQDPLGWVKK